MEPESPKKWANIRFDSLMCHDGPVSWPQVGDSVCSDCSIDSAAQSNISAGRPGQGHRISSGKSLTGREKHGWRFVGLCIISSAKVPREPRVRQHLWTQPAPAGHSGLAPAHPAWIGGQVPGSKNRLLRYLPYPARAARPGACRILGPP